MVGYKEISSNKKIARKQAESCNKLACTFHLLNEWFNDSKNALASSLFETLTFQTNAADRKLGVI